MKPEEIREIRSHLRLTQVEAGTLLGGGPRAFAKYESGRVAPSASLTKLLQLLDREPETLSKVDSRRRNPNPSFNDAPFVLESNNIMRLREFELPNFVRSLLHAEADAHGLPVDDIHVAEDYWMEDGGEDAHTRWQGGPARTSYFPGRYTQFQLKTGKITPAKASSEPFIREGELKPMVRSALEDGAHYVLLCTSELTAKQIHTIIDRIYDGISLDGLNVPRGRVHVWDASQIAKWTNSYPSIVTRIKERTHSGVLGPFRSWYQWADKPEHALSPLLPDERLDQLKRDLLAKIQCIGGAVQVVGPSGIGKSRLALECVDDQMKGLSIRDFIVYADQAIVEATTIYGSVQSLADSGARAIIVVDNCTPNTRRMIEGLVASPNARLSLVTIESDANASTQFNASSLHIELAPSNVTEAMVDRELPNLESEDRRRLELFSRGYPEIAIKVANAWVANKPIPYATEDDYVDAFVASQNDLERDLTLKTAMLVSTFGSVRHTVDESACSELSKWGELPEDGMRGAIERLIDRGVIQRHGRNIALQPRPIAMRLMERQWKRWSSNKRIELLTGPLDASLKVNAMRQLAWINESHVAKQVADSYLREDGPLDDLSDLSQRGLADVLSYLAEVDAVAVTECLNRIFDGLGSL